MAKADKTIVYDGQTYYAGQEIVNLGSFECVSVVGNKREYWGLSVDTDKLPKYDNLSTGSTALCLDTGEILGYHSPTKTWYKI